MFLNNPLMLIGLIAVAIPIMVHLFNFRRYKKIYFSNVDYLQDLLQETRKQSTIQQLLVLIARVLAIVCLVMAFAQPVKKANPDQMTSKGNKLVSIYLDNSFSMDNTNAEGRLLDIGKQKVREIVNAYALTDEFMLITNDVKGSEFRWLSGAEVLEVLNEVESSSSAISLSDIVAKQQGFMKDSRRRGGDLYVVSDMQRGVVDIENIKLDSMMRMTMVPLSGVEVANLYIDSLWLNAPCYQKGSSVVVNVRLRNTGEALLEKVPLTLWVSGRQRGVATADVAARGSVDVAMTFVVDDEGVMNGYVETMDYPITFDDRYYFSVNVMKERNVLVINDGRRNEYLDRLFDGDSSVKYEVTGINAVNYGTLAENDMIVLNEPTSISGGMVETLQEWVNNGGSLLLLPKSGNDVTDYNRLLASMNAPQMRGWQVGEVRCSGLAEDNELFRNVFDGNVGTIELPTIKGYYVLESYGNTHKEVVLSLVNGDDYLTLTRWGSGKMYVMATPLNKDWTDFGQQALVVPTLYNMALYSSYVGLPSYTIGVDELVMLQGNYMKSDEVSHVTDGGEVNIIPDIRRVGSRCQWNVHGEIKKAGNYNVVSGSEEEGVSLNYARVESEMNFLSRNEIEKALLDNHIAGCEVVKNANKNIESYIREQHQGVPLWRWCVLGCLLMILIEILLIKWPIIKSRVGL